MTKQTIKSVHSIKATFIAFAAAAVVGLSAIPAQAFSPASNSAATATHTAGSTIEQVGFKAYKRFRGQLGSRSHRSFRGQKGLQENGFHLNRFSFIGRQHSPKYVAKRPKLNGKRVKRQSFTGHPFYQDFNTVPFRGR
ncbi:MAG: hypothetical protein ABJK39_06190 [Hyphomicrobiales bacterium]